MRVVPLPLCGELVSDVLFGAWMSCVRDLVVNGNEPMKIYVSASALNLCVV